MRLRLGRYETRCLNIKAKSRLVSIRAYHYTVIVSLLVLGVVKANLLRDIIYANAGFSYYPV
jgi:hypothetical protein